MAELNDNPSFEENTKGWLAVDFKVKVEDRASAAFANAAHKLVQRRAGQLRAQRSAKAWAQYVYHCFNRLGRGTAFLFPHHLVDWRRTPRALFEKDMGLASLPWRGYAP
ncbi:MAG: hypothetical protein ABW167_07870 [Baekduia sp.]